MKVLPRNEEAASTAVAVEVSYNDSDDPNRLFRAEIEGISRAEFRKEVEELFEDKHQWDMDADDEEEERDTEVWQRMLSTVEKNQIALSRSQEPRRSRQNISKASPHQAICLEDA